MTNDSSEFTVSRPFCHKVQTFGLQVIIFPPALPFPQPCFCTKPDFLWESWFIRFVFLALKREVSSWPVQLFRLASRSIVWLLKTHCALMRFILTSGGVLLFFFFPPFFSSHFFFFTSIQVSGSLVFFCFFEIFMQSNFVAFPPEIKVSQVLRCLKWFLFEVDFPKKLHVKQKFT